MFFAFVIVLCNPSSALRHMKKYINAISPKYERTTAVLNNLSVRCELWLFVISASFSAVIKGRYIC